MKFMHIKILATMIFMNHETSVFISFLKLEKKYQIQTIYLNNMIDERFRSTQHIPLVISLSTIDMAL